MSSALRNASRELLLLLLVSCSGLAACGGSVGFLRDTHSGTLIQANLGITEFRHVKTVYGTAEYTSVLCFFPLGGDVFRRAMENLHQSAGLKQNQLVLNLREDHTLLTYFLFACNYAVTISGDVTEFGPPSPQTSVAPATPRAPQVSAPVAAPPMVVAQQAEPTPQEGGDVRTLANSLREAALAAEKDGRLSVAGAERAAKAWRTLADLVERNPYREEAVKKAASWTEAAARMTPPHSPLAPALGR